jgi:hypothetical protein
MKRIGNSREDIKSNEQLISLGRRLVSENAEQLIYGRAKRCRLVNSMGDEVPLSMEYLLKQNIFS